MDRVTLEKILCLAQWAPTPDNCQPWSFSFEDEVLRIHHDKELSSHSLNPQQLTSFLMLGCYLETLRLSARTYGFDTQEQIDVDHLKDLEKSIWARVRFVESSEGVRDFSQAIKNRTTDRRLFKGGDLETLGFDSSLSQYLAESAVQFSVVSKLDSHTLEEIVNSEAVLLDHPNILPQVLKWVRFTDKEKNRSRDGLSLKNLLVNFWEVPFLFLIKTYKASLFLFRPFIKRDHKKRVRQQIKSSAGLVCVSIPFPDRLELKDLLQAGRIMLRAWLHLTENGYSAQPISLATLPIMFSRFNVNDAFFESIKPLTLKREQVLKEKMHLAQDYFPVWMLRAGKGEPLPPLLRTLRRDTFWHK